MSVFFWIGTFMYDCHRERKENELHKKTLSIWTYVVQNKREFLNPLYCPRNETLVPDCSEKVIILWPEYYLRWDSTLHTDIQISDQQQLLQRLESVAVKLTKLKRFLHEKQERNLVIIKRF